jgi:phosphoribosylaminoimidazole (AIR) synthetase
VIPDQVRVALDRTAWKPHPIFGLIQERGKVDPLEMYRVFNMGMGMVLVCEAKDADRAIQALERYFAQRPPRVIGEVQAWDGAGAQVLL